MYNWKKYAFELFYLYLHYIPEIVLTFQHDI